MRLTGVDVDAAAGTARVEAGVRWGAVLEAAAKHGLAPLSGSSPDVGVVGYTLSGGFGLMVRKYGRAADDVRAIDVVTADGSLQHVEAGSDLFWALRGGRADFGIVTALEIGLVPVTELYGGGLYFGTEDIPAVLRAWRTWASSVPDTLTTSLAMIPYPDLPMVPEPLRGKHIAHVRVAYLGDGGDDLVAPLRAAAPALLDTLKPMPFSESGSIAAEPPHPHGYHGTNATVTQLNDAMLDAIVEHAGPGADVDTVLIVDRLGGALTRPCGGAGRRLGQRGGVRRPGAFGGRGRDRAGPAGAREAVRRADAVVERAAAAVRVRRARPGGGRGERLPGG